MFLPSLTTQKAAAILPTSQDTKQTKNFLVRALSIKMKSAESKVRQVWELSDRDLNSRLGVESTLFIQQ